jgi:hypothetical protein
MVDAQSRNQPICLHQSKHIKSKKKNAPTASELKNPSKLKIES